MPAGCYRESSRDPLSKVTKNQILNQSISSRRLPIFGLALFFAGLLLFLSLSTASNTTVLAMRFPNEMTDEVTDSSEMDGEMGIGTAAANQIKGAYWPIEPTNTAAANAENTLTVSATLYIPFINGAPLAPVQQQLPWLDYVNNFRSMVSLPLLEVNEEWSQGAELHSRYMVKNDYVTHYEDPENPWYSPEGYEAGRSSNIFVTSWMAATDEVAIDFWMAAPFHAISIIDPQLHTTGLGSYREDDGGWEMGASLDVIRGRGPLPVGTEFPLLFPPAGGSTWLLRYPGYEFPNPLTSCPGYSSPTGPPIMVQLGKGDLTPVVYDFSFETDGQLLESCLFDETTYTNPDSGMEYSGRVILNNRDAVVLMPREPLSPGKTYTATIVTDQETIQWTFTAISEPSLMQSIFLAEFETR